MSTVRSAHSDDHYGLINQTQLVAAFQAWTLDKARSLTDQFVSRGDLVADASAGLEPPLSHPSS
jgi:hypothetical protein